MGANYVYIERDVIHPSGIVQVYKDYWWWCVNGDPTRAIFYCYKGKYPYARRMGAPQCNADKRICQMKNADNCMNYPEGTQLIQIPLAFVPWED